MILGTSKILTFFGPIIGHFWARRPCICGLSYTKIPQIILESIWEHPGKILSLEIWDSKIPKNIGSCVYPTFWTFEISKYILPLSLTAIIYVFTVPLTQIAYWHSNSETVSKTEALSLIGTLPSLLTLLIVSEALIFIWFFIIFFLFRGYLYMRIYQKIINNLL